MTPMKGRDGVTTRTSGINVLVGIWLFVSPWVYGAARNPSAWNSWIVGVLIAVRQEAFNSAERRRNRLHC